MKKVVKVVLAIVLVVSVAGISSFTFVRSPKIAYVDLQSMYDGFPLKKELEAKLTNVEQARKHILDSLKIELNALSASIKSEKEVAAIQNFQIKRQEYFLKEKNFGEENAAATKTYSDQIWKQINQYVKDYGRDQGYSYILGIDGSGTVMFAAQESDITKEVSEYINSRYDGVKK